MEIAKRNFSQFDNFPGTIVDGNYKFPSLYHTDTNNNIRIWTITVRLIKGLKKLYKIDWNLLQDNTIPIKLSYLKSTEIPTGTITQLYVETGVITGKMTRHSPTYPIMKNKGKKNERNSLKQGLVLSRSLYLKKINNGFQIKSNFDKKLKIKKNIKYFPMLVRKYDDEKKNIKYPSYVQPKLDGARCTAFLGKHPRKNPTVDDVIMYTRQRIDYLGFSLIKEELFPILCDMWDYETDGSIRIDGELYKHGLSLQVISGAVRNPNRLTIPKYKGIRFHIFDAFYPLRSTEFKDRIDFVDDVFNNSNKKSNCLVQVTTIIVKSEKEQNDLYKKFLNEKYEGIIIRNADSLYLTSAVKNSTKIRSKYVLKRKMRYSDEFEVVGYTQGTKGRDIGAIIWICVTHDGVTQFNTTPKNTTYEERYKLYKLANANKGEQFNALYKGRMMTVEYEDLSKNKVPLRAKSIGFREHL
jgi:ATP-dependent DNA ligase